ncbi:PHP domain-containing protein [Paludicola sp. MB14-C6]|uniref:PHP domain-containing protein n=1 Tax=Paludihabitans sp. MB14-C6 TaxID=3070656 RepID=UPI0027DC33D8|nr:PHP domain-containing protein [Paludicola sp. MB14-C6]WMJ22106.1 PHP domain-containing protein [Paludicola sp. MB14-C6]
MIFEHDIHVHTFLSSCGNENAKPEHYIEIAKKQGLKVLGFSDHVWDSNVKGAWPWYQPQDISHVLTIKNLLANKTNDLKVLIGCEAEFTGNNKVAMTKEHAALFDYVLIPTTHFHMKDYVCPSNITKPYEVAKLMVQRFNEAVKLDIATGIAHPFVPYGFMKQTSECIALISDDEFINSFSLAKEHNVSIEIHRDMFFPVDDTIIDKDIFIRVLSLAKRAGCYFHYGSDSHSIQAFEQRNMIASYMDDCGITESDLLPLVRSN